MKNKMKHVFIINPTAGKQNSFDKISADLDKYKTTYDIEIYETDHERDATEFTKNYLENYKDTVRFYACGGDGTLNEVVNGVVGFDNASVSLYPCGSGNDFVKSVGDIRTFNNLDKLLNAENKEIDLIKIHTDACDTDYYSLNVTNFGFEAYVCKVANKLKKSRTQNAYTLGIVKALFCAMKNEITVEVDGEILNPSGKLLLCTLANGSYVGGKYKCAPRYVIDDGLMEICMVKTINVFKLISLIGVYEKGQHLDNKRIKQYIEYRRSDKVKLYSNKTFDLCIDGEIISGNKFDVTILNKAIKFGIPTE